MNILFSGTTFTSVKKSSHTNQNIPSAPIALYASTKTDQLTLRFGKDALREALSKAQRGCTASEWSTNTYCQQAQSSHGGYFKDNNGTIVLSLSGRTAYRRKFKRNP